MTDPPPASAPPSPDPILPPANSTKRPWTLLGRLSQAVREQNWFAVGLEVVIVVLGVVIGFQVTAWGAARTDAAKERTYLHQLADDLRETERLLTDGEVLSLPPNRATGQLWRAFYAPERPPRDSVLTWLGRAGGIWPIRPVLGTAEALVATGDLSLIRDDSLRSAITAYLDDARRLMAVHDNNTNTWFEHALALTRQADRATLLEMFEPAIRDSLNRTSVFWALPEGERRDPFPFDEERFLTSLDAYTMVLGMADMKDNMTRLEGMILARTVELREQIEAHLNS